MLQRVIALLSVTFILVFSTAAKEGEELKIGDPAPKFALKDADDKEYSLEKLLDKDKESAKVAILMMGNRSVRKQANKGAVEFDKIYKEKKEVVLLMVADLRGLPFFVTEGMVKWGVKRENLPVAILLDWEGKVNQLYKTEKDKPNVFVIDSDGKIAYCRVTLYSDKIIKEIQAKVQCILEEKEDDPEGV